MKIKQVAVFMENQPGRLKALLEALRDAEINMRALSVSETAEFGIVRLILNDADAGLAAIKNAGFTARQDWVVCVQIPDVPGGLLQYVIEPLAETKINVSYFYAFLEPLPGKASIVLKTDDIDRAQEILRKTLSPLDDFI